MKEKEQKKRTLTQNRALHLMFTQLSDHLNEIGLDMKKTLKPSADIWWNSQNIKEYLWRPVQKLVTTKESTTELTTGEVDKVFEQLQKFLGEKHGVEIIFPSIDEVINKNREQ